MCLPGGNALQAPFESVSIVSNDISQVFTGKIPFAELRRDGQVIIEVVENRRPPRPEDAVMKGLEDDVWMIMQDCWATKPSDRPGMPAVVCRLKAIAKYRN